MTVKEATISGRNVQQTHTDRWTSCKERLCTTIFLHYNDDAGILQSLWRLHKICTHKWWVLLLDWRRRISNLRPEVDDYEPEKQERNKNQPSIDQCQMQYMMNDGLEERVDSVWKGRLMTRILRTGAQLVIDFKRQQPLIILPSILFLVIIFFSFLPFLWLQSLSFLYFRLHWI